MLIRKPFEGLTIKAALLLGFGLTFGIWIFAGSYFTKRFAEVERRASAVNVRYVQAQELLSTVRVQLLLGSVDVRDALLDPNPATAAAYRRHLDETFDAVTSALQQYVPVLDSPNERERIARLEAEIIDYRLTMRRVMAADGKVLIETDDVQPPLDAQALFSTLVVPKRALVIRVFEEVQELNRGAFVQQQSEIAAIYAATQYRLWESLGLALAASLAIGLLAAFHAGRLEAHIREQRLRDLQTSRELQELSAKLITVQEEERKSIARELHDEVGQVLTTIKVELAVAQHAVEAGGGDPQLLADARSITDGALATVRNLSQLLRPPLLDDMGLPAAVEWYLRGFGKRHGIRTDVVLDRMEGRLIPEIESSAYRIVQEALTNVARHARATSCRVHLQRLPLGVQITVEDDGVGFDPEGKERANGREGLGLVGIRERASQVGGAVRIESAPGRGTRLTVELPARSVAEAHDGQKAESWQPTAAQGAPVVANG